MLSAVSAQMKMLGTIRNVASADGTAHVFFLGSNFIYVYGNTLANDGIPEIEIVFGTTAIFLFGFGLKTAPAGGTEFTSRV